MIRRLGAAITGTRDVCGSRAIPANTGTDWALARAHLPARETGERLPVLVQTSWPRLHVPWIEALESCTGGLRRGAVHPDAWRWAGSPALFASVLADNGLKLADQIDSWANGAYKVPTISDVVTIFER